MLKSIHYGVKPGVIQTKIDKGRKCIVHVDNSLVRFKQPTTNASEQKLEGDALNDLPSIQETKDSEHTCLSQNITSRCSTNDDANSKIFVAALHIT